MISLICANSHLLLLIDVKYAHVLEKARLVVLLGHVISTESTILSLLEKTYPRQSRVREVDILHSKGHGKPGGPLVIVIERPGKAADDMDSLAHSCQDASGIIVIVTGTYGVIQDIL